MTKTVKELADELRVSRQYVQKIISKLPATKKPTKVQHSYSIDNQSEAYIKAFMNKSDNHSDNKQATVLEKTTNELSLKYEKLLLSNVSNLKDQLKSKDEQIERLQKLLDQSQQLQLMAENEIKKLEDKSSNDEDIEKSKGPQQKNFWGKLFT